MNLFSYLLRLARSNRRLTFLGTGGLLASLALLSGLVWAATASAASPTTVSVPAATEWVDSGISLSPGTPYTVTATGVAYWYGGSAQLSGFAANANGVDPFNSLDYGTATTSKCLVPPSSYCFSGLTWAATGLHAFSLVGKIGANGTPFFVGEGPTTITGSGELYLTFNDTVPYYGDNYGGFTVTVAEGTETVGLDTALYGLGNPNTSISSVGVLQNGVQYDVTVDGNWSAWPESWLGTGSLLCPDSTLRLSPSVPGGVLAGADAAYLYGKCSTTQQLNDVQYSMDGGATWNTLPRPQNDVYNPSHTYNFGNAITGSGTPISFRINDTYGDDHGILMITLTPVTDTTPPVAAPTQSPAANSYGWNNTDVTVNWNWTDTGSGVNPADCTTSSTSTGEGADIVLAASCTDNAGNTGTASYTVKVDKTAPTITYTGNADTYTIDQTVNITCSASDNLSGVASTTCQNISGPAYSFALGNNTFSATATDYAGNTGSGSTSFTVQVTAGSLCNLTDQFETKAGVANSLCVKLQHGSIQAYLNEVSAQSGKSMTADQAAILTRLAKGL